MFPDNHSDQSISEEEDLGVESAENFSFCLSSSPKDKERSIQVLSQLEKLGKDANAAISSEKGQTGLFVEDEIEFPVFNSEEVSIDFPRVTSVLNSDEDIGRCHGFTSTCNSDEELISDEEKLDAYTFGSAKLDRGRHTWSAVNREVEAPVCLNENNGSCLPVGSSSKLNKSFKGGQRKVKPNLVFQFRSCEKAIALPLNDRSQTNKLHASATRDVPNSNVESLKVLDGRDTEKREQNLLPLEEVYHNSNKHSVTEFLECLQEKSGLPQRKTEIHYRLKAKNTKAVVKRKVSTVCDRNMDGLLDIGSSSDDEDILLNPKSVQQRTMADQFHEAFEAVSQKDLVPDIMFHRESRVGLFEKLQDMMVIEKERDMDFLKKFERDESSTDREGFIDVRILTRSLEAKLNVCCCALIGDEENYQSLNHFQMRNPTGQRILKIIFSSRICGDVELEVGHLIRVHFPWKEVNIKGNKEIIILSTYFCQL